MESLLTSNNLKIYFGAQKNALARVKRSFFYILRRSYIFIKVHFIHVSSKTVYKIFFLSKNVSNRFKQISQYCQKHCQSEFIWRLFLWSLQLQIEKTNKKLLYIIILKWDNLFVHIHTNVSWLIVKIIG